jgi:hypothetical protein
MIETAGFVLNKDESSSYEIVYHHPNGERIFFMPAERAETSKMVVISDNATLLNDLSGLIKDLKIKRLAEKPIKVKSVDPTHPDFIGTELKVGQWVGYLYYAALSYGRVTRLLGKDDHD